MLTGLGRSENSAAPVSLSGLSEAHSTGWARFPPDVLRSEGMDAESSAPEQPRTKPRGRPFPRGVSGNPGGMPAGLAEVKASARAYTTEAIQTLAALMRTAKDEVRVKAAEALLDRGWGRSPQALTGEDGGALALRLQVEQAGEGLMARLQALAAAAGPEVPGEPASREGGAPGAPGAGT